MDAIDRLFTKFPFYGVPRMQAALRREADIMIGRDHTRRLMRLMGLAGVTIRNDIDLVHRPIRFEELAKVLSCGIERNIADINIHARVLLCASRESIARSSEQYAEAQNARA